MDFDIIVLGSGIAGSITALVLAKLGLRVLVVERKSHPRFVIGESTVPMTSFLLRHLARTYDVPEIEEVAHYTSLREKKCAAWPKQHFWFGPQREGVPLDPKHEALVETLMLPLGPDVHMMRADADGYLASRLEAYGCTYLENTELTEFRGGDAAHVELRTADGQKRSVRAHWVIDATGHASFLASRFGLRDADAKLATNTRSLFTHVTGVNDLDDALGGENAAYRYRRSAGTMHHCFDGGWIWVIPFDSGVTSVGLQLDRRVHPMDPSVSPEDELARVIARFPSVQRHLGAMKPIRPIVRTDRVQFTSRSIFGDRFILTPHAASFVEPLFSTGIMLTAAFLARFAGAAKKARETNDWSEERFRFIESLFFEEIQHVDRIVDGTIRSFRHPELFRQFWRLWTIAIFGHLCCGVLAGGPTTKAPMLFASCFPGYVDHVRAMHALVWQDRDPIEIAREIHEKTNPWWDRICGRFFVGDFALGLERTATVRGIGKELEGQMRAVAKDLESVDPAIRFENARAWFDQWRTSREHMIERYRRDDAYRSAVDRVLECGANGFDYGRHVGLHA